MPDTQNSQEKLINSIESASSDQIFDMIKDSAGESLDPDYTAYQLNIQSDRVNRSIRAVEIDIERLRLIYGDFDTTYLISMLKNIQNTLALMLNQAYGELEAKKEEKGL